MLNPRTALVAAVVFLVFGHPLHSETPRETRSCLAAQQPGPCLVNLVRASRRDQELASSLTPSHQKLVKDALDALLASAPDDVDSHLQLLLESALASEIAEQNDGLGERYQMVCKAASDAPTVRSTLFCAFAELKVAMLGNDENAVKGAADKLLKTVPEASSDKPEQTAIILAKRPAEFDEQMFAAVALADYAFAIHKVDRLAAANAAGSAIKILLPFAENAQVDLTVASNVSSAILLIIPQPWDSDSGQFNTLALVRQAAHLSEVAFGKDNPRLFDVLSQLQFQLWNSRFDAMATELKESKDTVRKGDSGDPLAELDKPKQDKPASEGLLQENKALIQRLYSLALADPDAFRQEKHLEDLVTSIGSVDDMEAFAAQVLDKRVRIIDEAVVRGKLPISVQYESMLKVAENNLTKASKRAAGLATIEDVSSKLAKLSDSSKHLPRALLAEVHARSAAVQFGKSALRVQLPKAKAALKRADSLIKAQRPDPGADVMDLVQAEAVIEDMKKPNN